MLSLGSIQPKLQTVHGLKNHLQKCHPDTYAVYLKQSSDSAATEANRKKMKMDNLQATTLTMLNPPVQPTLAQFNASRGEFSEDVVQRIDKAVMDLLIVDMLPFSTVEGKAFKRLNFCDPSAARRYNVKSEKFYRTTLLDQTFIKVSGQVKKLLEEAEWVSFTTDVWSNSTKSVSLLSFTCHFVHDAVLRKVILSISVLEEDHTGLYLASKLREAISVWNLESKLHLGVRDNAANMVCAMRTAGISDLGCMAHTLQLVIHDALFTQTSVENLVKKARKIVSRFKHSEQACRKLADCQKSCFVPEHKLLQDVETRWNSTYLMLERLGEQRKAVTLYCVEEGTIDTLSASDWELAERIVKVLKPFYEATVEISSDQTCLSVMVPMVTMLLGKVQARPEPTDRGLQQLKAALRDAIQRRFAFARTTPAIVVATLLDPRFKDEYFNSQEKSSAMAEITNFLQSADTENNTAIGVSQSSSSSSSSDAAKPYSSSSLWDDHDNAVMSASADDTNNLPQSQQQLTAYLSQPRVARSTNIYQY